MKLSKIYKLLNSGRAEAIVKEINGRRMLFGFQRKNPKSRKRNQVFLTQPIDLKRLEEEHQKQKAKAAQPKPTE